MVCFLLLFLLISNSSPSLALCVSETNPSNVKTPEIREMENAANIQLTKRSLGMLNFYFKMIRQMKETASEKTKKNPWMLRYNLG